MKLILESNYFDSTSTVSLNAIIELIIKYKPKKFFADGIISPNHKVYKKNLAVSKIHPKKNVLNKNTLETEKLHLEKKKMQRKRKHWNVLKTTKFEQLFIFKL